MNKSFNLPNKIPVFPLSNFIIFPNMTVPLNIFEPRYIQMIDDCMKVNRMIGIIQPKKSKQKIPDLYKIGCAGKITSFDETEDGRYLIVLNGVSRFKIIEEKKLLGIVSIGDVVNYIIDQYKEENKYLRDYINK